MRRIGFSKLLLIVMLVPLAALMVFAGTLTHEAWSRYSDLVRASSLLRLSVAISRFCGIAIPAEGLGTRDYLADGDKSKLDAHRRITDELFQWMHEAAAAQLFGSAQSLAKQSANLKQEVEKFLDMVQAA